MRRWFGLVLIAMIWPLAVAGEPSAELQAKMTGRFRLAEDEASVQQRLAAAIEHAIEPMNFIARPIARSRLRTAVYYCQHYEMALGAEKVRVACDDRRPIIDRRLDNSEGKVAGLQSEPVDVKVSVGIDSVELVVDGADGTRVTTYRFGNRGELEVGVRVVSPRLERPVTWKVLYRRAD